MIARKLNENWKFCYGMTESWEYSEEEKPQQHVNLPHDAMILRERSPRTKNQGNTGFYPGDFYAYRKELFIPKEWEEKEIYLEFDGVYNNARVFLNGDLMA